MKTAGRHWSNSKGSALPVSFPRKRESSRRNSVMQAGERYAVYIMASRRNGTLYVGVTNNLAVRAHQHRTGEGSEFTRKYGVTRLVWYEFHPDINEAITSEKRIKKWERRWKLELIESFNPEWADLYEALNG
jgi:putative endonuclease